MSPELEKRIFEDYKELFPEYDSENPDGAFYYGIECGDGWERAIRNMCDTLAQKRYTCLPEKSAPSWMRKIKVKFHNFCRKIERVFNLKNYLLYKVENPRYRDFKGFAVNLDQIKEKYGGLRVYYSIVPRYTEDEVARICPKSVERELVRYAGYVDGVIAAAENECFGLCENDGRPGKLNTRGWYRVLCENCTPVKKTE